MSCCGKIIQFNSPDACRQSFSLSYSLFRCVLPSAHCWMHSSRKRAYRALSEEPWNRTSRTYRSNHSCRSCLIRLVALVTKANRSRGRNPLTSPCPMDLLLTAWTLNLQVSTSPEAPSLSHRPLWIRPRGQYFELWHIRGPMPQGEPI